MDPYDAYRDDLEADLATEQAFEMHRDARAERCGASGHFIPLGDVTCKCRSRSSQPVPEHRFTPEDLEASKAVGF